MVNKKTYMSYDDAVALIRSVEPKITSSKIFHEWSSTDKRPSNFPSLPKRAYPNEWISWGEFLGTGNLRYGNYLSYNEAMKYVRSVEPPITKYEEFVKWITSGRKPDFIPRRLDTVYKSEWTGFNDFIGNSYFSYSEARSYIQSLNPKISSIEEYELVCGNVSKTLTRRLPLNPSKQYADEWTGWPLFLGLTNISPKRVSNKMIMNFVKSLNPILDSLTQAELYIILNNHGFIKENSYDLVNSILRNTLTDSTVLETPDMLNKTTINDLLEDGINLPELSVKSILKKLDTVQLLASDAETIEFLIINGVRTVWNKILNTPIQTDIDVIINELSSHTGGLYSATLQTKFLEQYNGAINLTLPSGYEFTKDGVYLEPNLMQKLVAYLLTTRNRLGNYSLPGSGKTLSSVLTSRVIDANITVIITLNNTLSTWNDEILNAFPESNVVIKERGNIQFSDEMPNYLILNYELFQQSYSADVINHLLANHKIDMIVLDEIHRTKSREDATESKRRRVITMLLKSAETANPNLKVLGLSATPVISCLSEAKSLLELITGNSFIDLNTKPTINNALAVHQQLVINGIRYAPSYESINVTEHIKEVIVPDLSLALQLQGNKHPLAVEQILLDYKLEEITNHCKKGTIIYSLFVDSITDRIYHHLKQKGFSVGMFTGHDKTGLQPFLDKEIDVLIGSSTISTGIDGLQEVCDNMIIATLPWNASDYQQLIGRVVRQNCAFTNIDIVIPQIILAIVNEEWSWDKQRLARIHFKKSLADAAVDGTLPQGVLMSESELLNQSMLALDNWIKRIEENNLHEIHREPITIPEIEESNSNRQYGDFSQMNKQFAVSYSNTTHQRLQDNPDEFFKYHALYKEARTNWNEIPYLVIANKLKDKPYLVVADFGCGEALLAKELDNQVYSFDHIAMDDTVIECDMKQTILADNFIDVAVFSLSLQGLNWKEYLLEAKRSLKPYGNLFIAEPTYSWQDDNYQELTDTILNLGFVILQKTISNCGKFVYVDAVNLN